MEISEQTAINKIILGDNLEIMRRLPDECVDLVYLDPPFFSNRNYEVIWGDEGEIRSFQDRWAGGIEHYIAWLKERVFEMHRVLKRTGSIFLHCDWHASHYIKVDILDKIFGQSNFINEFIWKRSSNRSSISKAARKNHDTIFFYAKSGKYTYNQLFMELSAASKDLYKNKDEHGYYQTVPLLVSGKRKGKTGKIWKNIDPNKQGQEGMHWVTTPDKLDEYDKQGLVYFPKNGKTPRLKYYLEQSPGVPLSDVWDDIPLVQGKERIGYPTQKPESLLERIVGMASNKGDFVLDPFLGGGTTTIVADKLHRRWIGIDQSVQAVKVTDLRFQQHPEYFTEYTVQLHKYDYDTLRYQDSFKFEEWIVQQYGGISNVKQRGDYGIDGRMPDNTPIQVKRSDGVGRKILDEFVSAVRRFDKALLEKNRKEKKPVGYIIAFSFGKGIKEEVARLKNKENIIIKLVTVEEIVPFAKKPAITVNAKEVSRSETEREIEFTVTANSDAGIEFYSWDFSYNEKSFKPDVLRETEGRQRYKFKPGSHRIAVKVIDNEGLEGFEIFTLTLNGRVKQSK